MVKCRVCVLVSMSLALAAVVGCSPAEVAGPIQEQRSAVADNDPMLPVIPPEATPETGHVEEYWANGMLRSERQYRDGQMVNAEYYASNGELVYEMSSSHPEPKKTSDAVSLPASGHDDAVMRSAFRRAPEPRPQPK